MFGGCCAADSVHFANDQTDCIHSGSLYAQHRKLEGVPSTFVLQVANGTGEILYTLQTGEEENH